MYKKKKNKVDKNYITFSVKSVRLIIFYYLLNNSRDYHTYSVFNLLNYVKSVVKFYLGIKVVLY